DAVVSAHDRASLAFDDRRAEGGEIRVLEIAQRDVDIRVVTRGFGTAVHGEVLGRGDHVRTIGIVSLHAAHVGHCEARGKEWILAEGLLPAAPARITEDVDVRRPGVEAGADTPETAGAAAHGV